MGDRLWEWGEDLPVDHDTTFWSPLAYDNIIMYRLLKHLQNKYEGLLSLVCTHHVCMGWCVWVCHHIQLPVRIHLCEGRSRADNNDPAPPVSTPISVLIKDRQSLIIKDNQSLISLISSCTPAIEEMDQTHSDTSQRCYRDGSPLLPAKTSIRLSSLDGGSADLMLRHHLHQCTVLWACDRSIFFFSRGLGLALFYLARKGTHFLFPVMPSFFLEFGCFRFHSP